jgi:hypothetical protein
MGLSPDEKWMAAREGTWIPVREFDYDKGRVFEIEIHRIVKYRVDSGGGGGCYWGPDFDELVHIWEKRVFLEERAMTASVRVPRMTSCQTQSTAATSSSWSVPKIFRNTIKKIERYASVHRLIGKLMRSTLNGTTSADFCANLRRGVDAPQTGALCSEPGATNRSQSLTTMAATLPLVLATVVLPRGESDSRLPAPRPQPQPGRLSSPHVVGRKFWPCAMSCPSAAPRSHERSRY